MTKAVESIADPEVRELALYAALLRVGNLAFRRLAFGEHGLLGNADVSARI